MIVTEPVFANRRPTLPGQLLVNFAKIQQNLVADARSQTDRRTWSPHKNML
jgi:hypothetical protein